MAWVKVLNLHTVLNEAQPLKRPIPTGAGQVENSSARARRKTKEGLFRSFAELLWNSSARRSSIGKAFCYRSWERAGLSRESDATTLSPTGTPSQQRPENRNKNGKNRQNRYRVIEYRA